MSDPRNKAFIQKATEQAIASGHIFPQMAACEAAVESASKVGGVYIYGASQLAVHGNNLFGTKAHAGISSTIVLPTIEHVTLAQAGRLPDEAVQVGSFGADGKADFRYNATWASYANWAESFKDRMATLERLKGTYPHYAAALVATDPITYVKEVSQTWSTGEGRADECISIYHQYFGN